MAGARAVQGLRETEASRCVCVCACDALGRYHDTLLSTWKELRYLHARLPQSTLTKEECDDWTL